MKLFDCINKERILKPGHEYYYPFYITYSKVESKSSCSFVPHIESWGTSSTT